MKKPAILLTGTPEICRSISDNFIEKSQLIYISAEHLSYESIKRKMPFLICIVTEKETTSLSNAYNAVLTYSRRTRCPVYVFSDKEGFALTAEQEKGVNIRLTSLASLSDKIQAAVEFADKSNGDRLCILKSRFEAIALMSDNAAFASYCGDCISTDNTSGKRIILTSSDSEDISEIMHKENNCSALIITENLFGDISDGVTAISNSGDELKTPVLLVGTGSAHRSSEKISYINIETDNESKNAVITAIKKLTEKA